MSGWLQLEEGQYNYMLNCVLAHGHDSKQFLLLLLLILEQQDSVILFKTNFLSFFCRPVSSNLKQTNNKMKGAVRSS
jgi:hypothetical protein